MTMGPEPIRRTFLRSRRLGIYVARAGRLVVDPAVGTAGGQRECLPDRNTVACACARTRHPLARVEDRHADELIAAISQDDAVVGQLAVGRALWALEAHVEHIGLLVEVEPDLLRRELGEMRQALQQLQHYAFVHRSRLLSSCLPRVVKNPVITNPSLDVSSRYATTRHRGANRREIANSSPPSPSYTASGVLTVARTSW